MTVRPRLAVAAALLLHAAAGWAQDHARPMLTFDGFGTIGVVHSDEEHADFVANSLVVPEGAGHTSQWSAEVDSRLGLQLTAEFTPRTSAVGQVVIEQQHDDSYEPEIEWLNLTHEATPDLRLRAGRVVLPVFMASDYRKVGYANPWVRPPQEVCGCGRRRRSTD